MNETVINRIKKLLALASHNPEPNEREAALAKAQQLMLEHRIEAAQLLEEDLKFVEGEPLEVKNSQGNKRKLVGWVVCEAADVGIVYQRHESWWRIRFVGRLEPVAFAGYLYPWLEGEYDRQWELFRLNERKARRVVNLAKRDHFHRGLTDGLLTKLAQGRKRVEQEHALILVAEAQQSMDWYCSWKPDLEDTPDLKEYKKEVNAYQGGREAAKDIRLNRQIPESQGAQRFLLGQNG